MSNVTTATATDMDGFPDYKTETETTPLEFIIYVTVHVLLALSLVFFWITTVTGEEEGSGQDDENGKKGDASDPSATANQEQTPDGKKLPSSAPSPPSQAAPTVTSHSDTTSDMSSRVSSSAPPQRQRVRAQSEDHRNDQHRQQQHYQRNSSSDHRRMASPSDAHFQATTTTTQRRKSKRSSSDHHRRHSSISNTNNNNDDTRSHTGSAATTSCIFADGTKQRPSWEPSNMRWKHRQPMGRVETLHRTVQNERSSAAGEEGASASGPASIASASALSVNNSNIKGLSGQASSMLAEERIEGEAEFYRKKYLRRTSMSRMQQQKHQLHHHQLHSMSNHYNSNNSRRPSIRSSRSIRSYTSDGVSVMPALSPDQVSPDDAADAHDPGQSLPSISDFDHYNIKNKDLILPSANGASSLGGGLLDLANPDRETLHILRLAIPSTLMAIADPLYRIILAGIISHKLGTDAMVSFVLVLLLLRLTTDEISGALLDAEWSLVQSSLNNNNNNTNSNNGFVQAGKYVQLGMIMQLAVGIPVLLTWVFVMEDAVFWMVNMEEIARQSANYTQIIVIDYMLQGATRAFMLVFHLTDRNGLESAVDAMASVLTLVTVAAIIMTSEGPTLEMVAYIQVVIGLARTLAKVTYASIKGWVAPYRAGLCQSCSLGDRSAVFQFVATAVPLFAGSLIELREWELLAFATRWLGGAELATWVVMGIIWEIFEASVEGLGEAAAVRVSFYLAEDLPVIAKRLCNKVIFWTLVLAALSTSVFLMAGPNIASSLTIDMAMENLLFELVGMTGLANIAMNLAQVYWSLVGAQGRFGLASCTILLVRWTVAMPLAFVCIFYWKFELNAVAGSIAVGYATAAVVLAWKIYTSKWDAIAQQQSQEQNNTAFPQYEFEDDDDDEYSSSEESEFSEDDSDLF